MTDSNIKVLILGATGLVGRALVQRLIQQPNVEKITVILRQDDPEFSAHPSLNIVLKTDFLQLQAQDFAGYSHVFSCLGTTIAKAGSKQAFYAVDYAINAHVADCLKQLAQPVHFLLVSAMGADAQSRFFYNRVKGELETHVQSLELDRVSIFRPSLLMGERQEQRRLEQAGQKLFQLVSKALPKQFKYKPVTAQAVAEAMLQAANGQIEKFEIYDNLSIQQSIESN